MLILTRRKNESVCIGGAISITVIRVSGNKVRLGISAPQEVRVLRIELDQQEQAHLEINGSETTTEAAA